MSGGISLVRNGFRDKSRTVSSVRFPNAEEGTVPESRLLPKFRTWRLLNSPVLSGILPSILLLLRSRTLRELNPESCSGIVPQMRLLLRFRT